MAKRKFSRMIIVTAKLLPHSSVAAPSNFQFLSCGASGEIACDWYVFVQKLFLELTEWSPEAALTVCGSQQERFL